MTLGRSSTPTTSVRNLAAAHLAAARARVNRDGLRNSRKAGAGRTSRAWGRPLARWLLPGDRSMAIRQVSRWRPGLDVGGGECGEELLAGGDVELLVGVGEVPFDGSGGDEEVLRDLAVG